MTLIHGVVKRFSDLSIAKKLYGCFLFVAVVLLVAVVVGWTSIGSVAQTVKRGYGAAAAANQASAAAYNMHVSQVQNVADGGKVTAMHKSDVAAFQVAMATLHGQLSTSREKADAHAADIAFARWSRLDKQVSALATGGNRTAALALVDGAANSAADGLSSQLTALGQVVKSSANASSSAAQSSAQFLMVILALVSVGIASALAFLLSRSLASRARQMLEAATGIAAGDVDQHVDAQSKDELGRTALAFQRMIEYLKTMVGAAGLIAEGDLTVEVTPQSERDALGNAFRAMTLSLRQTVSDVSTAASSVSAASDQMASTSEETGKAVGEIASAIGQVAEGAERQVQMVESATATASNVADAIAASARNAQEASNVADHARVAAGDGVQAAQQATAAMQSVRDSSHQVADAIRQLATKSGAIGAIVETITQIAEQTNLLALNAAIEAARAGEQGRGFAVVAEEVRKLAEESQQAAGEISELIGQIQSETNKAVHVVEDSARRTDEGTQTVEQTREAFERIGTAVADMAQRVEEIAAAAQQVASESQKVQESIGDVAVVAGQSSAASEQVSASTEETSASTQEIAASAQALATTADDLARLISHFKVAA